MRPCSPDVTADGAQLSAICANVVLSCISIQNASGVSGDADQAGDIFQIEQYQTSASCHFTDFNVPVRCVNRRYLIEACLQGGTTANSLRCLKAGCGGSQQSGASNSSDSITF